MQYASESHVSFFSIRCAVDGTMYIFYEIALYFLRLLMDVNM